MFKHYSATLAIALLALPHLASAVDETVDPELIAKLRTAATNHDREQLLPNDSDWLFDFTVSKSTFQG